MARYRKKPVVTEAFQMTRDQRYGVAEWPDWLCAAWRGPHPPSMACITGGTLFIDETDPRRERLLIGTLEGVHEVSWGDFIIQGIQGELYPCKPDIFWATYDLVEEEG